MLDRKSGKALVKFAADMVSFVPKVSTLIATPAVGSAVPVVAAVVMLGPQATTLFLDWRVRRALHRATKDGHWQHLYREKLRQGGEERLRRELLEVLRDLEGTIEPNAVEAITRLFEYQTKGAVEWQLTRVVSSALRRLSDVELATLKRMVKSAATITRGYELVFSLEFQVETQRPELVIGNSLRDHVRVTEIGKVENILRALVASGAATTYASGQAYASSHVGRTETIVVGRDVAELLTKLLSS